MLALTHMVPIPPPEPPKINAFTSIARLIFYKLKMIKSVIPTHNLCTVI